MILSCEARSPDLPACTVATQKPVGKYKLLFFACLDKALRPSQHFFIQVRTFSCVEPVLSNEDSVLLKDTAPRPW